MPLPRQAVASRVRHHAVASAGGSSGCAGEVRVPFGLRGAVLDNKPSFSWLYRFSAGGAEDGLRFPKEHASDFRPDSVDAAHAQVLATGILVPLSHGAQLLAPERQHRFEVLDGSPCPVNLVACIVRFGLGQAGALHQALRQRRRRVPQATRRRTRAKLQSRDCGPTSLRPAAYRLPSFYRKYGLCGVGGLDEGFGLGGCQGRGSAAGGSPGGSMPLRQLAFIHAVVHCGHTITSVAKRHTQRRQE